MKHLLQAYLIRSCICLELCLLTDVRAYISPLLMKGSEPKQVRAWGEGSVVTGAEIWGHFYKTGRHNVLWMEGWRDGWMDGWRDGWMEGWMDKGGMEGWIPTSKADLSPCSCPSLDQGTAFPALALPSLGLDPGSAGGISCRSRKCLPHHRSSWRDREAFKGVWLTSTSAARGWRLPTQWNFFLLLSVSLCLPFLSAVSWPCEALVSPLSISHRSVSPVNSCWEINCHYRP